MNALDPAELPGALELLASWSPVGGAFQLHVGDLGWHWRYGASTTAQQLRTWRSGADTRAIGLLDGTDLRVAIDPGHFDDERLAASIVESIEPGIGAVEAPLGSALRAFLERQGWGEGQRWSVLACDVTHERPTGALRAVTVTEDNASQRVAVQRAAFVTSTFTLERWRTMTAGPAFAHGRDLLGLDASGVEVAGATVWSSTPGGVGLIEPLGVGRDHRGVGHGVAIVNAALNALRDLGSSAAVVATPATNAGGIATYERAGMVPIAVIADLQRP